MLNKIECAKRSSGTSLIIYGKKWEKNIGNGKFAFINFEKMILNKKNNYVLQVFTWKYSHLQLILNIYNFVNILIK